MDTPLQPWELVYDLLHREGWSLGWCQQRLNTGQLAWVADASKGKGRIISDGRTLGEAFGRLYQATRRVGESDNTSTP